MSETDVTITPAQTALVLADFQPAVLASLPAGTDVVTAAQAALAGARAARLAVAHVRVAFNDEDYAGVPSGNKMFAPVAAARYLGADAPEAQFDAALAPIDSEIVVRKTRVGAFSTTDLHEQLQARGIDTLILAGVSTAGVILSTVRAAADLDYRLIVLADACADHNPQLHAVLTEQVLPAQATVLDHKEFLALLSG
jgi:nicotinamidase-related amidase